MSGGHLIGKQLFDLRLARPEAAHEIEGEISRLSSERLAPAFANLFDRLVAPDQLIRVGRIELDIGTVSRRELFSDAFTRNLLELLEAAIGQASDRSSPAATVQPLRISRFELWLHFLENGCLPSHAALPQSHAEWHRQVLDTLAEDASAVQRLRQLLVNRPVALERLVLQYDAAFLQHLLTLVTGHPQESLPAAIREASAAIVRAIQSFSTHALAKTTSRVFSVESLVQGMLRILVRLVPWLESDSARKAALAKQLLSILEQESVTPGTLAQWLTRPDFWRIILQQAATPEEVDSFSTRLAEWLRTDSALRDLGQPRPFSPASPSGTDAPPSARTLRQMEISLWRILLVKAIVQRQKVGTPELLERAFRHESLRHWRIVVSRTFAEKPPNREVVWRRVSEALHTLAERVQPPILERDNATLADAATEWLAPSASEDLAPSAGANQRPSANQKKEPSAREKQKPPKGEDQSDSAGEELHYIPNAGVIILHPFLPRFFRKLGLGVGEDDSFRDELSRQKAVFLVHHLATGELQAPEYQLILPKLLTGMPLNAPLDLTLAVSEEERIESEKVLQAAIDHWGALGSTSPAGLREGFLQRAGKLERRQSGWFLQVERKTLDILLDRLPWGIGMVKLPWMEDVLRIEWR